MTTRQGETQKSYGIVSHLWYRILVEHLVAEASAIFMCLNYFNTRQEEIEVVVTTIKEKGEEVDQGIQHLR